MTPSAGFQPRRFPRPCMPQAQGSHLAWRSRRGRPHRAERPTGRLWSNPQDGGVDGTRVAAPKAWPQSALVKAVADMDAKRKRRFITDPNASVGTPLEGNDPGRLSDWQFDARRRPTPRSWTGWARRPGRC